MKQQNIILVGGGDSYTKREDFLSALKIQPLRDLPQDKPYKSWKSWLIEELGDDYYFDSPSMPNKDNAKYDEWKIWFERHLSDVQQNVILIGVSLGAMFLAKYLIENNLPVEIKGLFLLAGPCGYFDDDNGNDCISFGFQQSDLGKIKGKCEKIIIMHSEDDFVVPYESALEYKKHLPDAELVTFTDKNHFLIEEFPELLEHIRSLAN